MITTPATLTHKYDSPSGEVSFVVFQPENTFSFQEGQFMMIEANCFGKVLKNPYSIATTNQQLAREKQIGFYIKKASDSGVSARMTQEARIGDRIELKGPVGHYTDSKKHKNYLFVSTGSGLSPNLGIFQHLVYESKQFKKIVSIFGERTNNDLIPSIQSLLTQHYDPRVTNLHFLSRQQDLPSGYCQGRVQQGIADAIKTLGTTEISAFICGSPEMVKQTQSLLEQAGVDRQDITIEKR